MGLCELVSHNSDDECLSTGTNDTRNKKNRAVLLYSTARIVLTQTHAELLCIDPFLDHSVPCKPLFLLQFSNKIIFVGCIWLCTVACLYVKSVSPVLEYAS